MKKFIIILGLISASSLFAQRVGTIEINGGYGFISQEFLSESSFNNLRSAIATFTFNKTAYNTLTPTGPIYISGKIALLNGLMMGMGYKYEDIPTDIMFDGSKEGFRSAISNSINLEIDYHYIGKKVFQMYLGIGGGINLHHITEELSANATLSGEAERARKLYVLPSFQITILGFRIGKSLGLFGELGYGYKGIINLGISYQIRPL